MMSQILKSVNFTETQKFTYLENETLLFLQIKNSLITHQGLLYGKNSFVEEVTFNIYSYYIHTYVNYADWLDFIELISIQ